MSVVIGRGITLFSLDNGLTTVHTGNGLSGDGSVATPVVLGGTLTAPNTTIIGNGNVLAFEIVSGAVTAEMVLVPLSATLQAFNSVSGDEAQIVANGVAGLPSIELHVDIGATTQVIASKNDPLNTNALGWEVADTTDNVGLNGRSLFPINNPNQYAQYGNLASILGTVNTPVEVAGALFTVYSNTGSKKQLVQVNVSLLVVSTGTGCTFTVQMIYVDGNGTSRTVTLGTASTLTPMIIAPQVLYINSASAIGLQVTYGGTNDGTYQLFADCEFKGVQN